MDMDTIGFFLFMEEQERKAKEQHQEGNDDGTKQKRLEGN